MDSNILESKKPTETLTEFCTRLEDFGLRHGQEESQLINLFLSNIQKDQMDYVMQLQPKSLETALAHANCFEISQRKSKGFNYH